ncbi:membrane protein [Mesorhizobium sp. LSHC426A00]|nr:membrane protein [Mesorhizobium sp. LSHC426A00]ESZ06413.1 membrane protein [Mesorhizobium sp. L2C089B000]
MRLRRVSRRGLRSTVSNRAGNSAMTLRRTSGVIPIQAPISSRVRPQPKQKPVFMSIEQTRMHGDSMAVMTFS